MGRSKRPASPEPEAESSRAPSKRLRLQELAKQEVIDVDEDNDAPAPPRRKSKRTAAVSNNDSDIEVIEDPVKILARKQSKGKGKAKARSPATSKAKRSTRVVHDVEEVLASSEAIENDAEMARRMALEWGAEPSPEPTSHAGPSSRSAAPAPSPGLIGNATENTSTGAGSSGNSQDAPAPGKPSSKLELPYINLPNPALALKDFKSLLTSARPCSKCNNSIQAPHTRDFKFVLDDPDITKAGLRNLLHVQCTSKKGCKQMHCRGCFKAVGCADKCGAALHPQADCEVYQCCAEIRAIALFEALSAFDRQHLEDKALAEKRAQENVKKRSNARANATVGPGGTGYAAEHGGAMFVGGMAGGMADLEDMDDMDDYDSEMEFDFEGELDHLEDLSEEFWGQYAPKPSAKPAVVAQAPEPEVEQALSESDQALMQALALLTELLPAPYSSDPAIFDFLPHPSLGALLLMSFIPSVLADLLRNDSVMDWIARNEIYHAMLLLLKRMGDSELTVPVLVGHRPEFNKSSSLDEWMWGQGEFAWVRNEDGDVSMAQPLLEHFKKLKKQADTFLHSARAQLKGSNGGDSSEASFVVGLSLCSDIVSAQDDIKKAMEAMHHALSNAMYVDGSSEAVQATYNTKPSSSTRSKRAAQTAPKTMKGKGKGKEKGKGKATEVETSTYNLEKEYIAACEKLSFEYVSFPTATGPSNSGPVYQSYKFAKELQQTQNATRIPKARLHYAKELAVMATSLPPGIWVRIDEVRNDAIKIMIAGPQGTPYADGLFEFDCFIPLEYPNRPPVMHLRTTGGGTVRFNPNLYNCGKVCLSLLGTWSGTPEEQWTSKSTLLQVLVSIQSMILIEAPYFNEPGFGAANLKAPQSIKYNQNVSLNTVRWAMVDWLKDEHRDGIWKDVIKSHFTLRKEKIQQQIAAWAKDDARIRAYSPHAARGAHPTGIAYKPSKSKGAKGAAEGAGWPLGLTVAPPAPSPSSSLKTMDLLSEFEEGMKRVEAWPSEC